MRSRKLRFCTWGCIPRRGIPSPMRDPKGVLLDGGGGVLDSRVRSRAAGPLSTACPPGCPGSSRLRARPDPLRWCLTGSFCRVLSCRLLRSSCRRTAANIAPPARSQVSLIADAPHVFKSTGIWASERLGDRTMPPEVMGTLDTGCTKKSPPPKKIFALWDCVQVPCYVERPPRTQRHEVGSD